MRFFLVGGLHIAAEIRAVDLDLAGDGALAVSSGEGFAEFVGEHKRRLVLAIQVAAQLQGTMALRAVHEDRDGQEDSRGSEACGWRRSYPT